MNAVDLSTTIPDLPAGCVQRENVNMTIDAMLHGDVQVVVVEGREGVGKTTLLNGYARSRGTTAICVFLRPVRSSYDSAAVISELASQVRTALGRTLERGRSDMSTRADLGQLVQRLSERLRAQNRTITIVVDGLADVANKDRSAAEEIVESLPFGRSVFRFLMSGSVESLLRDVGCVWKSYPLTLFSVDETRQLLRGLGVDDGAAARAHAACNGVVAHLAAVRRLVQSGVSIDEVIENQPGELTNIMLLEWQRCPALTISAPDLLSILAFDARRHSIESLARLSGRVTSDVAELVASATFLERESDGEVDFISETFRRFAQRRLEAYRQATLERCIAELLGNHLSREAVTSLPALMKEAKQYKQLVELMGPEYLRQVACTTESVAPISVQSALAAEAAEVVDDDAAGFRFRLIQSISGEMRRGGNRDAEVLALIAVGEDAGALAMARQASFREERLRLFARALAAMADRGQSVAPALRDELRQLCTLVDVAAFGDEIVDIAGDVFSVDPEAALQLMEKYGAASQKAQALDWIIATVSMRHVIQGRNVQAAGANLDRVHERIADPALRSLSQGIGLLNRENDAEWILERASQISESLNRLTVLRLWLELNGRRPDAVRVAAYALNLAINTPEYAITVPVLRQFAMALPYADDNTAAAQLIGRIDALAAAVPQRSPSAEYTRLQLLLARAQAKRGLEGARLRIIELYLFIDEIRDPAVKAECTARLLAWAPSVEPDRDHSDLERELSSVLDECLRESAYHDDTITPVLRPLVSKRPEFVFSVVDRINTDRRRDYVRSRLLEELANQDAYPKYVAEVVKQLGLITDPRVRSSTVVHCLARIARKRGAEATSLRALWGPASALEWPEQRALAFAYLHRAAADDHARADMMPQMLSALKAVKVPERRCAIGFDLVVEVAAGDRTAALALLKSVRDERETEVLSAAAASALTRTTRLAARALRGSIRAGRDCSAEMQQVLDLYRAVPDVITRAAALGELCYWAAKERRQDISDRVYSEYLWPTFMEAKDESSPTYWQALSIAGWAMFVRHERQFVSSIDGAPARERERIVSSVVRTIALGVPPTEPCDLYSDGARVLQHKDCTDMIALLGLVCDDSLIYYATRAISRTAGKRDTAITREQRIELAAALTRLIAEKLPCAEKIRHDGYKWACTAEVLRMAERPEIEWREVVGYAKDTPNSPDAAYTLTLLAAAMPPKLERLRGETIELAVVRAKSISVVSERSDCLVNVADEAAKWDRRLAQELLREAVAVVSAREGADDDENRIERVLDVAYRVSPEFALALSSEIDTDAARGDARRARRAARRAIETRQAMVDDKQDNPDVLRRAEGDALADAAWRNLGALNANAIVAKLPHVLRSNLAACAKWPLDVAYPVFAWVVQNWVDRTLPKAQQVTVQRAMAQNAIVAAEFVRAVGRTATAVPMSAEDTDVDPGSGFVIVGPRERQLALSRIRDWCAAGQLPYLKIADQFFGPNELELLKCAVEQNPDCRIEVMTSAKHLKDLKLDPNWEIVFRDAWARCSVGTPPNCDIYVVSIQPSGKSPIHDRWWITEGRALDFGTSLNALGYGQESKVTMCDAATAAGMEKVVDKYLLRRVRWMDAGRVSYLSFSL